MKADYLADFMGALGDYDNTVNLAPEDWEVLNNRGVIFYF